jgi:hypothetical protein
MALNLAGLRGASRTLVLRQENGKVAAREGDGGDCRQETWNNRAIPRQSPPSPFGLPALKPSGAMSRQSPLDLVEQCPQPGTAIRVQHVDKSNSPE